MSRCPAGKQVLSHQPERAFISTSCSYIPSNTLSITLLLTFIIPHPIFNRILTSILSLFLKANESVYDWKQTAQRVFCMLGTALDTLHLLCRNHLPKSVILVNAKQLLLTKLMSSKMTKKTLNFRIGKCACLPRSSKIRITMWCHQKPVKKLRI